MSSIMRKQMVSGELATIMGSNTVSRVDVLGEPGYDDVFEEKEDDYEVESINVEECPVCYLKSIPTPGNLCCNGHFTCLSCRIKIFKRNNLENKCPVCRIPIRRNTYVKPTYISSRLRTFLQIPSDAELSRSKVTMMVHAYIKEHDLQNPNNRREILADKNLLEILIVEKDIPLTYFNLRRAIEHNFNK